MLEENLKFYFSNFFEECTGLGGPYKMPSDFYKHFEETWHKVNGNLFDWNDYAIHSLFDVKPNLPNKKIGDAPYAYDVRLLFQRENLIVVRLIYRLNEVHKDVNGSYLKGYILADFDYATEVKE